MEAYVNNFIDYHAILDLTPKLSHLYFSENTGKNISLSPVQAITLIGIGLQHKTVDDISEELNIKSHQTLSMFLKVVRKFVSFFRKLEETEEETKLPSKYVAQDLEMKPTETTLEEDLDELDKETRENLQNNIIDSVSATEYTVLGDNEAWDEALKSKKVPNIVSVKKEKMKMMVIQNHLRKKEEKIAKKLEKTHKGKVKPE